MKLKGLKKAVGEFQRYNQGGYYSPDYGVLMFDKSNGQLWADYFYSIGHNTWKKYDSPNIINLSKIMSKYDLDITMNTVKQFINENFEEVK